jgi:trimethylamine--corrinoid protein Co-methyltransferase
MHLWSESDLDAIERTALQILDQVGVKIESPAARKVMLSAGCKVEGSDRVRIPAAAVSTALEKCPRHFRLPARDRPRSLEIAPERSETYAHNMSGTATVCDAATGERRPATCHDQGQLTRVMHHLRNQHLVCPMVQLQDVPSPLEPLYSYLIAAWETDKYVSAPGIDDGVQAKYLREMGRLVLDAELSTDPVIDFYVCLLSPLCLPAADADKVLAMAEMDRVAVMIIAEPTAGTTAPVTLSAAIAQQHAELLAGVVLLQAAAPGTPTTLGPRLSAANLRSGLLASGRYSTGLASAAAVELARRCGLACGCYGLCTDSIVPDAQFGYERAINGLLGLAGQPRFLSGIGDMQSGLSTSPEALLIDDDILAHLLAAVEGQQVDTEVLNAQIISEGVNARGGFLSLDHTRRYRQRESIEARVAYSGGLDEWMRGGWGGTCDRARAMVPELLSIPPVSLPEDVLGGLCELVDQAARDMGVDDYPEPRRVVLEPSRSRYHRQ